MNIAVAISGGIDSLVSAYLLKEQGHNVIGLHFITGYENSYQNIQRIANQLDIEVKIIDCKTEFQTKIVDYFIKTYKDGKTPNPCLVCNPLIKFGVILDFAKKFGVSHLATGHYAKIIKDNKAGFHLFKGKDKDKDQSYFLAFLNQNQLKYAFFPLSDLTKSEVKKIAQDKNLYPVTNKESQDICFIQGKTYADFLANQKGFNAQEGLICDVQGKILGRHKGLHLFTTGQRKGINCPASQAYYVIHKDIKNNRLIVGFKNDLLYSECKVININWINHQPHQNKMNIRVRYRSKETPCEIFLTDLQTAIVKFENPQSSITPGQGAVFYKEDEILGGGWIEALSFPFPYLFP